MYRKIPPPRLTIPMTGPISLPGITSLAIAKIWFVAHKPSEINRAVAKRKTTRLGAIMANDAGIRSSIPIIRPQRFRRSAK
jgi:hypothetical protein